MKDLSEMKENSPTPELIQNIRKNISLCKDASVLFRNNQTPKYELESLQKAHHLPRLVLPANTRWGSNLQTVKNVSQSLNDIRVVTLMPQFKQNCSSRQKASRIQLSKELADLSLEIQLTKTIVLLERFNKRIKEFETNTTPLSHILPAFSSLLKEIDDLSELSVIEKETAKTVVLQRRSFLIKDVHLAATLLDPNIDFMEHASVGEGETEFRKAVETITEYFGAENREELSRELSEFISFKNRNRGSPNNFVALLSPLDFWKFYESKWTSLAGLAIKIFSLVCSTAEIERSFSQMNYIHSKTRNRLQHSKVAKILFIKANYLRVRQDDGLSSENHLFSESFQSFQDSADQITQSA